MNHYGIFCLTGSFAIIIITVCYIQICSNEGIIIPATLAVRVPCCLKFTHMKVKVYVAFPHRVLDKGRGEIVCVYHRRQVMRAYHLFL